MKVGTAKLLEDASIKKSSKRDYLGASILGEECERKLWYSFYKPMPVTDPRLQRIFDMGNIIEDYIVELLRKTSLEVWNEDGEGNQFGFKDGLIAGHCDGVVRGLPESGTPHLLEIKSANSKRWTKFNKEGCKSVSMTYWVQCQVYMYKLGLKRCLFVVMNKDNQELYLERIESEKKIGKIYIERGKAILDCPDPPGRKYTSASFYKCKWCDWRESCWFGGEDESN